MMYEEDTIRVSDVMQKHKLPDETIVYVYTHRMYRMHGHWYVKTRYEDTGEALLICRNCSNILKIHVRSKYYRSTRRPRPLITLSSKSTGKPLREEILTCDQVKMDTALG